MLGEILGIGLTVVICGALGFPIAHSASKKKEQYLELHAPAPQTVQDLEAAGKCHLLDPEAPESFGKILIRSTLTFIKLKLFAGRMRRKAARAERKAKKKLEKAKAAMPTQTLGPQTKSVSYIGQRTQMTESAPEDSPRGQVIDHAHSPQKQVKSVPCGGVQSTGSQALLDNEDTNAHQNFDAEGSQR